MKENYMEMDIQGTVERLHIDEKMINTLIKMTLNGDMLDNAKSSYASNNLEDAKRAIHTIKGTAANVGLNGLSNLALEMELKLKENEDFDFELLGILEEVWKELKLKLNI